MKQTMSKTGVEVAVDWVVECSGMKQTRSKTGVEVEEKQREVDDGVE